MSEEDHELDEEVRGTLQIIAQHLSRSDRTSLSDFVDSMDSGALDAELYEYLLDHPDLSLDLVGDLEEYFDSSTPSWEEVRDHQGPTPETEPSWNITEANATKIRPRDQVDEDGDHVIDLESNTVDLIVTSPPYWQKRDYGSEDQLGQEPDPETYIENLIDALEQWKPFLRSTGSVFLNIGDTYRNKSLQSIPGRFAAAAVETGWTIRNEITWAKDNGIPSSARDRLVPRHEAIYHLVLDEDNYFYDLQGYSNVYGNGSNPGDVWRLSHDQNTGSHLAPFPADLVRRAITMSCPPAVCEKCGEPRRREVERGLTNLNMDRPQAQRALQIFEDSDTLTRDHIRAIQAIGISDVGKATEFQEGAGENADRTQKLAKEAKDILGGYFREFTFPQWTTVGWTTCDCDEPSWVRGTVLDPFAGSGTTIQTAKSLGCNAFGVDLDTSNFEQDMVVTAYDD